jgi:hypothetical protein
MELRIQEAKRMAEIDIEKEIEKQRRLQRFNKASPPKTKQASTRSARVNGAKLLQLRGRQTQEEFADKCGVPLATYQRLEYGGPSNLTTIHKVEKNLLLKDGALVAD